MMATKKYNDVFNKIKAGPTNMIYFWESNRETYGNLLGKSAGRNLDNIENAGGIYKSSVTRNTLDDVIDWISDNWQISIIGTLIFVLLLKRL